MTDTEKTNQLVVRTAEELFQFAIDRGDMNVILDALPPVVSDRRVTMEYEIQLLRIISVGWAIAFFLTGSGLKTPLSQRFWDQISTFSSTLSTSASVVMGSAIDYFDLIRTRLDYYVAVLDGAGQISAPAMAIGPAFAELCGDKHDACAVLAGSKMFTHTINAVRDHLDSAINQQG